MNSVIRVTLNTTAAQLERLQALQTAFAQVCNVLAPLVQSSRVWNRVVLHHLHYRTLRDKFPALGSQMVCNAIYAVSRTSRLIYQSPGSPFNLERLAGKPLPLLLFSNSSPVYFDRHTLSLKGAKLSLFTLDGRMHFELELPPAQLELFRQGKLREIVLTRRADGCFELAFWLGEPDPSQDAVAGPADASLAALPLIPDYVSVEVAA
jgi:hypothetical protein